MNPLGYVVMQAGMRLSRPVKAYQRWVDRMPGQYYQSLLDNYGIRRTDRDFWRYSDELHAAFEKSDPLNYGLLDYNRLENR